MAREVHPRDPKPGNGPLDKRGEPLVSDLGLTMFLDAADGQTKGIAAPLTNGAALELVGDNGRARWQRWGKGAGRAPVARRAASRGPLLL